MSESATDRFDFLVAVVFMLFSFIFVIIEDRSWMFFFALGIYFLVRDIWVNRSR